MKRLLSKKTVLLYVLTALLLLSLSFFAAGMGATEKVYAASDDVILDAKGLRFENDTVSLPKYDSLNWFGLGTDNWIIEKHLDNITANNYSVNVEVGYPDRIYGGANDAVRVEIRLFFNRWDISVSQDATYMAIKLYNSEDTDFQNPLASAISHKTNQNFIRTLSVSPDKICDTHGELSTFVLRVYSDAESWGSSVTIDYIKIVYSADSGEGSAVMLAGECITDINPENVSDNNVLWMSAEGFSDTNIDLNTRIDFNSFGGICAYVDNPALAMLSKGNFPNVGYDAEEDALLLKNAVFALNVGNLIADDYEQFVMDILLSDKRAKGNHSLYLYGSSPERFVDENGNPVGYAAKITVESYEQGFHNRFVLDGKEEVAKLAGNDGTVSNIYVLYHGNTLDTAEETVGIRNGSQIWINKVQFLKENDVETPVLESEYEKYDISEVFPVGQSVNVNNKAAAAGDVVSNAALRNKRVSELSFALNMASGNNLCLLFNATGLKQVNEYLDGGILFYLSDGNIKISSYKDGEETRVFSAIPPVGTFTEDTAVKIECIPYYINAVEAGFYCAVWIGGDSVVSGYFANDYLSVGNAFHLCYQAKSTDFSVKLGSAKTEDVKSAAELMRVKLDAVDVRYSLDKTDIPLALSWYETAFDTISEFKCDGDAAQVNKDAKRVEFSDNGKTNVSFSITNAFGTFNSNEISLTCEDVIEQQNSEEFYNSAWFKALYFLPLAVCVVVCAVLAIKKSKSKKCGK